MKQRGQLLYNVIYTGVSVSWIISGSYLPNNKISMIY